MIAAGYRRTAAINILKTALHLTRTMALRMKTLSAPGCFADAEVPSDLNDYPWPDTKYLDFSDIYNTIDQHQDKMVFTGLWSPFFHVLADFFGMQNLFIKMFESPSVVHALVERLIDYYVAANEKFFAGLGDRADVMFFGKRLRNAAGPVLSLPIFFVSSFFPASKSLWLSGKNTVN